MKAVSLPESVWDFRTLSEIYGGRGDRNFHGLYHPPQSLLEGPNNMTVCFSTDPQFG